MTGWEIDLMVANDQLTAWEELCDTSAIEKQLHEAAATLGYAIESLRDALANVENAADELEGTTEEDKVRSYCDGMGGIIHSLEDLKESWG